MRRFRLGRGGQIALAGAATLGVVIRWFATPDSDLHTFGTLLSVLWLWIACYAFFKLSDRLFKGRKGPQGFATEAPVVRHLRIEASFRRDILFESGVDAERLACLFLLGNHGFTARLLRPAGSLVVPGATTIVDAQFLAPELALPRFAPGTEFHIVVGREAVGTGRALSPLGAEPALSTS